MKNRNDITAEAYTFSFYLFLNRSCYEILSLNLTLRLLRIKTWKTTIEHQHNSSSSKSISVQSLFANICSNWKSSFCINTLTLNLLDAPFYAKDLKWKAFTKNCTNKYTYTNMEIIWQSNMTFNAWNKKKF